MQDSVVFDTKKKKKKKFFNAGIVEQSVRFDTHGNSDAGNQLKDFLNKSKYQFVLKTANTIFFLKWSQISELHGESFINFIRNLN